MSLLSAILPPAEVRAIQRAIARRAYERRYYHSKAKPKRQAYEQANKERIREAKRRQARARYWRDPERFRTAARQRMRDLTAKRAEGGMKAQGAKAK